MLENLKFAGIYIKDCVYSERKTNSTDDNEKHLLYVIDTLL